MYLIILFIDKRCLIFFQNSACVCVICLFSCPCCCHISVFYKNDCSKIEFKEVMFIHIITKHCCTITQ
uniref:Uncharacterized protein n=1 Tax=Aegilops tauschii subsp. strangulata TaxID=200361 RepID=A0A453KP17_AEGTS